MLSVGASERLMVERLPSTPSLIAEVKSDPPKLKSE
jgi:hypothetical protein